MTNQEKNRLKKFAVWYSSKFNRFNEDKQQARIEYASNSICAKNQAIEHFRMFGYGDEKIIEVIEW